jgi:hypothetical protein
MIEGSPADSLLTVNGIPRLPFNRSLLEDKSDAEQPSSQRMCRDSKVFANFHKHFQQLIL